MSKRFYRVEKEKNAPQLLHTAPWEIYQEPFRIAPHVYYVSGNDDFAVYLIDTGDGLIVIDTTMAEVFYQFIDSIHRIGFDPRDIKKILITHAHLDHDGGARLLKEMSGAEIYISKEDWEFKPHSTKFAKDFPYEPDHFYDDNTPITLGNFSIRTKLTPGHTPGVTSFFFTDTDENGKSYNIGMHGGVGVDSMRDERLAKDGNPPSIRERFISDCEEMKTYPIDICLPSHANQTNLIANVPEDKNDFTPFIDTEAWPDLMEERKNAVLKILK